MNDERSLRILHLEGDSNDVNLISRALAGLDCEVHVVASRPEYANALEQDAYSMVLSDTGVPGFDGLSALELVRQMGLHLPFLFVSGSHWDDRDVRALKLAGAADCVRKCDLDKLVPAIKRALRENDGDPAAQAIRYARAMERLVTATQELSMARDLPGVMSAVRRAARDVTGSDGASIVLRDGDMCEYVDENAMSPLWRGRRFSLESCISGWTMLNRRQAVVEDVYADPRCSHETYRATFVKSLAMVPIVAEQSAGQSAEPIGAIGNYWARQHCATVDELKLLQALADSAAVALENVRRLSELEQRVKDRTLELQAANKELESFTSAVSHDLRAPLRHIGGFAQLLLEDCAGPLGEAGRRYLTHIGNAAQRMGVLIEDLLKLSRTSQISIIREKIDIGLIALEVAAELQSAALERPEGPGPKVDFVVAQRLATQGDPRLMRIVMEHLVSNARKFSSKKSAPRIEVGSLALDGGEPAYFVRDNGAGFDMAGAGRLFGVFQRLHSDNDFPGTGVGLATAQSIVRKHGGRIWAEAVVGQGATFYFTLG